MGTLYKYAALLLLTIALVGVPGAFWAGKREGRLDERGRRTAEIVTALNIQREAIIRQERESARKTAASQSQHRQIKEGVNREKNCDKVPLAPCWQSYLERLRDARKGD